jgi:Replication-relaxation
VLMLRDIAAIRAVAHYYVLSRAQLQTLCYPTDATGRVARKRLDMLVEMGFLHRTPTPIFNRRGGSPWPAYYPSPKGCDLLSQWFKDERYLLTLTSAPPAQNLLHCLAVSDVHAVFDAAVANQEVLTIERWINEYDFVNLDEEQSDKRFKLFTLLREYPPPRIACAPDAAFLLCIHGDSKIHYLEMDRETSGVRQVASKAYGYAGLFDRRLHRQHFPNATVERFAVLLVTLSAKRRSALARAFRGKPHADLWRFVARDDLAPESCLFDPIYHRCTAGPLSLINADCKVEYLDARVAPTPQQSPEIKNETASQ